MKNLLQYTLILTGLLATPRTSNAQQVSNPETNIPVAPTIVQYPRVDYPGFTSILDLNKFNYVRTQVPDVATPTWPPNNSQFRQTTEYMDGLGRSLQTVAKNVHSDSFDIVTQRVYDNLSGRETYSYLPFTIPVAISDGLIETAARGRIQRFYDAAGPDEQPFSKKVLENAPVSRVTKGLSPGRNWVGSDRGVTYSYRGNTAAEGVRIFTIGSAVNDIPITSGIYSANNLQVTKTMDEDGKYNLEYKDKNGRTVLVKSWLSGTAVNHDGYACTYYVYDEMQRLRYTITPKAVATISTTWNVSSVTELCYANFYDGKGRLIEKRVPGKDPEYYVYDRRNRKVYYQDAGMKKNNQWLFTVYDALNRPICTGLKETSDTRATLQVNMDNASTYSAPDLRYYLKNYGPAIQYPGNATGHILSFTYYDNYGDHIGGLDFDPTQFDNITLPSEGTVVPSVLTNHTRGLVTGTKVRVKDPDNPNEELWIPTVFYYDDKGRTIQTQTQNLKGGIDITSSIYYFQGMLWRNILKHENPEAQPIDGAGDGAHLTYKIMTTTKVGIRPGGGNIAVKSITQKIDDGIEYQFGNYYYDHMGREVTRQTPAANFLHEYNMRGFLNHINVGNTFESLIDSTHIFEENLYFDKGFTSRLYNGNIAGITWRKSGNFAPVEAYGYSYDPLNRLTHAEYRRVAGTWTKANYDYSASNMTYDINGNLQSMSQRGINPPTINSPIWMDQLTYNYKPNSNELIKVTDAISGTATQSLPDFKDNPSNPSIEYEYDDNGNLVSDVNKGISSISYSYLNKPEIIANTKGHISYVYDAFGNLVRRKVYTMVTNSTDVYDYIGKFVYRNDTLQLILNNDGRARPVVNTQGLTKFKYDYFVKDHLGNVRSTVTAEPIDQEYLARHEISTANVEQLVFDNIPNVRDARPDNPNQMAAKLDGGDPNRRVGTSIMLKVMPGDKFTISADAFYEGEYRQGNEQGSEAVIESLMGALLNGNTYAGVPLSELPENVRTITQTLNNPALAQQLAQLTESTNNPNAPKAHLNVLFFNDKMELVEGGSSITQVPVVPQGGVFGGFLTLTPNAQSQYGVGLQQVCCVSPGPGYIIVYVDNQSVGKDVWFDNIMIEHYKGITQEEHHYYPYGGTIQTDLQPNAIPNRYLYNGISQTKELGLEMYDAFYRDYDPQLGRFWQLDPKPSDNISSYAGLNNNPVVYSDNLGDTTTFYNSKGVMLFVLNDDNPNRVSIVNEGKEKGFFGALTNGIINNSFKDLDKFTETLQRFGISYDLQSINKFYKDNIRRFTAKTIAGESLEGTSDYMVDGKPVKKIYAEAGAYIVLKDGVASAGLNVGSSESNNRFFSSDLKPEANSSGRVIHLHPVGDKINFRDRIGMRTVNSTYPGDGRPSNEDYDAHSKYNDSPVRSIMVNETHIYLFNRELDQTIKIPR